MKAPATRVRILRDAPVRPGAKYVLYWMTSARRARFNFALEHAASWARELGQPLLVLEGLRADYPWASERVTQLVVDGMHENANVFERRGVGYVGYVEPRPGAGRGLLARLARDASLVVADDYPAFFLPRMLDAAAEKIDARLEAVDSNGLFPMRATGRVFTTAHSFRAFLQKTLPTHLEALPARDPLRNLRPMARIERPSVSGRPLTARRRWKGFLDSGLERYGKTHSGLSPSLHFGHLSVHELFADIAARYDWGLERIGERTDGSRSGWWSLPEPVESFLDELVTWRELGFNRCALTDDYDQYESLPQWARDTLEEHASDPREYVYDLETFEAARTHDPVWNAAQRQLLDEGTIHSYLRMLWGKKILEWTAHPRVALDVMIELNNRYALDGRDPNSYSGIFWVLGRYDRAWGPERSIFGKIRYMSSVSTKRKLRATGLTLGGTQDGVTR